MSFLANLHWRYATKQFDSSKKVAAADLQKIRDAISLAPTAYGVQMFAVVEVVDTATRELMTPASYSQAQVSSADRVFVFCARSDGEQRINSMFTQMSGGDESVRSTALAGYESMVRGAILSKSKDELLTWSQKNAGIALGFAIAACAELRVDACPMEGFNPLEVKQILNLSDDFLPVAYLAVGYRDASDPQANKPKFRSSIGDIFSTI